MQFADLGQAYRRDLVQGANGDAISETQNVKNASGTKRALCIDNSDAEDFDAQDGGDDFFDCQDEPSECEELEPDDDSAVEAQIATGFAEVNKRRVLCKTLAADTIGLPLNPQITKQEQRRLKGVPKSRSENRRLKITEPE